MTDERSPVDGELTVTLPAAADAPAIARRFVGDHAAGLPPELVDDALLLVSELVTNAVRHGRPEIVLRLRLDPPGIGVAIDDAGAAWPAPATQPPGTQPNGRGLLIVDAIASRWGVVGQQGQPGKTVWFELHVPDRPA